MDYLEDNAGNLVAGNNNLEISGAVTNDHKDGGNWTITDNKGTPDDTSDDVTFKNTILSSSVTSGNEVNNGKEDDKKVVYGKDYTISDTDGNTATLSDVASAKTLQNVDTRLISTEGDVETINNTLTGAVMYDKDGDIYDKTSVTLGGSKTYDEETKQGGTRLTNVAYATGDIGSEAVNVDYLEDTVDSINNSAYKGWTVSANGDNKVAVPSNGNVDFSNNDGNIIVGQNGTNLTFDLNDNITLGKGNNQININATGTDEENSSGKIVIGQGNKTVEINNSSITLDKSLVIDGSGVNGAIIHGLSNNNWDPKEKDNSTTAATEGQLYDVYDSAVKYDNSDNKATITLEGSEYNGKQGGGTRLTNVAYATGEDGSEAVNVNYLEDTVDSINNSAYKGWTVSANGDNKVAVPSNGNVDFSNTDGNIVVGQDSTNLTFDLNDNITLGKGDNQININATGTDEENSSGKIVIGQGNKTVEINNSSITLNKSLVIDGSGVNGAIIHGLSNNNWDPKEKDNSTTAATEGQLYDVYDSAVKYDNSDNKATITLEGSDYNGKQGGGTHLTNVAYATGEDGSEAVNVDYLKDTVDSIDEKAYKGWTVSANGETGKEVTSNGNVDFSNTDGNIVVGQKDTNLTFDLNPVVTLDGNESDNNKVVLDGNNGTINVTNKYVDTDSKPIKTIANTFNFDNEGATFINTTKNGKGNGNGNPVTSFTNIDGGIITVSSDARKDKKDIVIDGDTGEITGLSNTEWEGTTITPDRAATEGQLQDVAIEAAKHTTVSGDKNITVKHEEDSQDYQVTLNDKVYLGGDHTEDSHNIVLDGDRGVIGLGSTIALDGRDGTAVIGGVNITTTSEEETGKAVSTITGLSNTTWEGTTETPDRAATEGQLQSVATEAAKHTTVSGDENITVKHEEGSQDYQVTLNPDVTLKGDNSSIELNGTKGTMQVNQETTEGTDFTNINGNVVSIGYTNSEGIENAIVIDGGKGTITGLSNTTWDDELAKQVANSEELQGTAATQGQLQQAVSAVATEAAKQHTTVSGDDNLTVTSKENTNGGTNYQVSLNDDITLGDKTSTSITLYTDPKSETTVVGTDGNTTNVTGYVPESYKSGTGADFVKNNGGFALFTTDTQGHGIFGVTTKGTAHGKDFVTYTKDIYNNSVQYSLNDVGNIVTQISHAVFDEGVGNTGMEYTLISDFTNESDKETPFEAEKGKTRTIGLAVRQDGAVIVGAVVNDQGISSDYGIRINAETETTYDENGEKVTNNVATITGLENTEWKPKAPEQTPQAKMATFAANDETTTTTTTTSRAATEAQLDDLYNVVSVYNTFDNNGNVNYNTIKLRGDEYSYNKENPVDSKGTVITNVAYSDGTGSDAVNVDYLNDAIAGVKTEASGSDKYLSAGAYDQESGKITLTVANSQDVVIDGIASKDDITKIDNKIDNTFNDLKDKIKDINTAETDVKGGSINEDGTISLKTENDDGTTTDITLNGNLTDSGVIQDGTSFDGETGTLTITSQDKYSKETSSVTVSGIASKDDIGAVTDTIGVTSSEDLKDAYKDADKDGNATTAYITESESMVEADVALDHAIQDVANTGYANDMVLSNRIDSVEKRLGNVEERIDKVGAMAAAIANLRTMGFDPEAPTEIAIGVGQYKSETGIAIGVFHYPNQDFMLSASLSSSGDELMGGIGATWKLGRKSAAERAKDEEARHLEQAEEMKKLAQQEKVKAQAQRHAKLLAERQQASQKNA